MHKATVLLLSLLPAAALCPARGEGVKAPAAKPEVVGTVLLCPRCGGAAKDCRVCGGLGHFRFEKCRLCRGEGGYEEYDIGYEKQDPKWKDCRECGGKGWLLRPCRKPGGRP
jgi:hypothetical protein